MVVVVNVWLTKSTQRRKAFRELGGNAYAMTMPNSAELFSILATSLVQKRLGQHAPYAKVSD